jgi:hypothetical protein
VRVKHFQFRRSGSGLKVSDFRFRVEGFGLRVEGVQVSGFGFRESATGSWFGKSDRKGMNSGSCHIRVAAGPLHGLRCRVSE